MGFHGAVMGGVALKQMRGEVIQPSLSLPVQWVKVVVDSVALSIIIYASLEEEHTSPLDVCLHTMNCLFCNDYFDVAVFSKGIVLYCVTSVLSACCSLMAHTCASLSFRGRGPQLGSSVRSVCRRGNSWPKVYQCEAAGECVHITA